MQRLSGSMKTKPSFDHSVNSLEVYGGLRSCIVYLVVWSPKLQRQKWHSASSMQAMSATVNVGVNNGPISLHNRPLVWVKFPFNPGLLANTMKVCLPLRWSQIFPQALQVNSVRSNLLFLWLDIVKLLCAQYMERSIWQVLAIVRVSSFEPLQSHSIGDAHGFTYL